MHRSALRSGLVAILFGAHALTASLFAQIPTQCLEIESILVDACNPFATCDGSSEGQNEMVRFRTGPNPIALSDLEANWPNGTWRGIVQNTTTASITEQLNSTIVSCGFLLEPPGGVIPPGSSVLLVTSTEMCLVGNSFEALTDTIYLIFQNAGNTAGHFANSPAAGQPASPTPPVGMGVRTLILFDNATNCSDTVSYVRELLVNTEGTYGGQNGETDGGTVEFTWPGVPDVSYVNYGCQAPFDPLFVQAEVDGVLCGGTGTVTLTGEVIGGTFTSVQWQGGTGTFGDPNALNTTYTAGPGDLATVILTLCAQTDCVDPICGMVSIPAGNGPTVTMVPSGPVSLCPGDEVVLTATGADSYLWSTGETTGSISVTSLYWCHRHHFRRSADLPRTKHRPNCQWCFPIHLEHRGLYREHHGDRAGYLFRQWIQQLRIGHRVDLRYTSCGPGGGHLRGSCHLCRGEHRPLGRRCNFLSLEQPGNNFIHHR
ncbi:MAG: hypothetical protein IPF64_12555 [Flavobacteriales bacterium]|nr:hypothetical protein [Flavobacteriales bacterium]